MLIEENRVAIRVHYNEARGPGGVLICLAHQLYALRLQLALEFAHVGECIQLLGVLVPAGIEGQDVPLEHTLKKTDHMVAILQDEPVLGDVSAKNLKTELLIERFRSLDILHGQADGECAEFQILLLSTV